MNHSYIYHPTHVLELTHLHSSKLFCNLELNLKALCNMAASPYNEFPAISSKLTILVRHT